MKDIVYRYKKIIPCTPAELEALMAAVGKKKRLRLAAYVPSRQIASLSADLLARELFEAAYGSVSVSLEDDETGAPMLVGADYFVSLSHSGEYAAAAISPRRIGIDIEAIRSVSDALIRRILSADEQIWVRRQADSDVAFLRLWTMREAYGKLKRTGIFTAQCFRAEFDHGVLCRDYPDCRFFFPPCPDGYTVSICAEPCIIPDDKT